MVSAEKTDYEELKKKYDLPAFEKLESEFQLCDLDECKFLLPEIRKQVVDKLDECLGFLSELLNPDTNLVSMYESRIFNESEKKHIFDIFKRLMVWKRKSLEMLIQENNAANAQFIKNFMNEWEIIKPKMLEIAGKVTQSWEADLEQPEKLGYFG